MEILANIVSIIDSFWGPVRLIAILIGYMLVGIGLLCFAMMQSGKSSTSPYTCLMMIIAGFLMVSLDSFLKTASYSMLGQSSEMDVLGYSAEGKSDTAIMYVFAFAVVKLLGFIAGIKGIFVLYSHSTQQKQSIFTGFVFLIMAVIGLNFEVFLEALGTSLGGAIESSISKILDFQS